MLAIALPRVIVSRHVSTGKSVQLTPRCYERRHPTGASPLGPSVGTELELAPSHKPVHCLGATLAALGEQQV